MRIIYVEDDLSNIALLQRVARMTRDELTVFTSPEDALAQAQTFGADLILTDIDFGSDAMSGLDLTESLRAHGVNVPVIALSSHRLQPDMQRAGAQGFLVKPFDVRDLLALLENFRPQASLAC